jgi:uncharacterized protein
MPPSNAITWFEIPVNDLDRAGRFYETVLGTVLKREDCVGTGHPMAVFPAGSDAVSGCLMSGTGVTPGISGSTLYLHLDGNLDDALTRARDAGARMLVDVTALPGDMGRYAVITDSEGNRIGLHQIAPTA